MTAPPRKDTVPVDIPRNAYGLLVDFCLHSLGCERMPDAETVGLVLAQLLAAGVKAIESEGGTPGVPPASERFAA